MANNPKVTTSQTPAIGTDADVQAFLAMYSGLTAGQKAGLTKSIPGPDGKTIQQRAAAKAAATRLARNGGTAKVKTPTSGLPIALQNLLGLTATAAATNGQTAKVDPKAAAALLQRIAAKAANKSKA